MLTGNQDEIYDLANFSYGTVVYEDENKLKDNSMHSGALLLVDRNGFIRGMYDGKDNEAVDRLIVDIQHLQTENLRLKCSLGVYSIKNDIQYSLLQLL